MSLTKIIRLSVDCPSTFNLFSFTSKLLFHIDMTLILLSHIVYRRRQVGKGGGMQAIDKIQHLRWMDGWMDGWMDEIRNKTNTI